MGVIDIEGFCCLTPFSKVWRKKQSSHYSELVYNRDRAV